MFSLCLVGYDCLLVSDLLGLFSSRGGGTFSLWLLDFDVRLDLDCWYIFNVDRNVGGAEQGGSGESGRNEREVLDVVEVTGDSGV